MLAQINPLDPNGVMDHAARYDSPTFLFALFILICAIMMILHFTLVQVPEARKRNDINERLTSANERHADNGHSHAASMIRLVTTQTEAHNREVARDLRIAAMLNRGTRAMLHLSDAVETVAVSVKAADDVRLPLAHMRREISEMDESTYGQQHANPDRPAGAGDSGPH